LTASIRGGATSTVLIAVLGGTLAGFLAIVGAETSPAYAIAGLLGIGVMALAIFRPIAAIYLAVLLIPVESVSVAAGQSFALTPAEFVALAAAAGWLLHRATRGGAAVESPLIMPLLALLAVQIPGLLLADDRFAVVKVLGMWSAFFILFIAVLTDEDRDRTETTAAVVAAAGGMVAAIAVVKSVGSSQAIQFGGYVSDRAAGTLGSPVLLGAFVAVTLPLQLMFGIRGRTRTLRIGGLAASATSLIALSLSLTRGSWVALAVAAVWLVIVWRPARRLAVIAAVLLSAILLTGLNPFSSVVNTDVLLERITSIGSSESRSTQQRLQLWEAARRMAEDRMPFGVGSDNFARHVAEYGFVSGAQQRGQAHNIVLNFAAELGILGLAVLIWLVISLTGVLAKAVRNRVEPNHSLAIAIAAAFLTVAVDGMFEYSFSANAFFLIVLLLAACAARLEREARVASAEITPPMALAEREPLPA
jgi:O-antigen ligase